MLEIDLEKS